MRDPARIDKVCEKLKEVWKLVPDWRLGQLVYNMVGHDPFFIEDEDMYEAFQKFIKAYKENK